MSAIPSPAGALPVHLHDRKATWFELFFDLVFVVAVAELSAAFAHHHDLGGAAQFALAFLAMWWCWLGHTFHATRFDEDRAGQRAIGFAQVVAVAFIAYGAGAPLAERAWAFAGGIAAFKALLALAYGSARRRPAARGLARDYGLLYALQALLWLGGLATGPAARLAFWGAALALDLASPWWVARHTTAVPPHPEHLPERFGLFTIILLGEGMAAVVHALAHGPTVSVHALGAALGGAATSFLFWIGYFDMARGHAGRHVGQAEDGRDLRLWAFAHVPLYLGVAALAAGTVALLAQPVTPAIPALLHAAGAAFAMLGISALGLARRRQRSTADRRRAALHAAVALALPAGVALAGAMPVLALVGAVLVTCAIQLGIATRAR